MCPGLLCTDSALLCSGFYLPAQVGITSSKHRANSPDPRPQGQVPRVQVPAIPQHGKGANCLGRPQDNTPPLPSPLAQQEKILCARVIRMEFLFNASEVSSAQMHRLKHLALSEFLSLGFPYFCPGNPVLKCSVLLFGEVTCLFLQR